MADVDINTGFPLWACGFCQNWNREIPHTKWAIVVPTAAEHAARLTGLRELAASLSGIDPTNESLKNVQAQIRYLETLT